MRRAPRSWLFAWTCALLWACSAPSGCACGGFTQLPQGSYSGTKMNTAGAARLSAHGFGALNANAPTILDFFAPGGQMTIPVPCSIQQVSLAGFPLVMLAIADTGQLSCASPACGRMDGQCNANDYGHSIALNFTSLSFAPKGPDILEAKVTATVATGRLPIASTSGNSALCLFSGRAMFTVDLDTGRAPPSSTDLNLDIKFAIDTRWDQLLSLEVVNVGNAQACSGGVTPPNCIDPNDMEILNEGCSALNIASLSAVKTLLINQLTNSLKTQISDALADANCASCGPMGECPHIGTMAMSTCEADAGVCNDTMTGKCVPSLLGVEGRLEVGQALGGFGAPANSAIELSFGAGGNAEASDAGLTVGLRGGAKEVAVASCVAPLQRPAPMMLPLPNFDVDAPAPYDVGLSVSSQMISEVLFRAQQSGALCLELGQETVSALESDLLGTLLPSLKLVTHGDNVPLRVVIRPVNPPTAFVGEGTIDANGKPLDPLITMDWRGLELDVYAQLEDRLTRLFTVSVDLKLPLGLTLDGCSGVTPVIGNVMGAVTNVQVKNNEILAEPVTVLQNLVPSLLTLVEPQLAAGFQAFTIPDFNGFQLKMVGARGIGKITGTQTYNHLALYAELLNGVTCVPMMKRQSNELVSGARKDGARASLQVQVGKRYSVRVDGGFWSTWRTADSRGQLDVEHPRLLLSGAHRIEIRSNDGEQQVIALP